MSPESALTAPTAPPALDWAAFREALLSRYWPLLLGLAAMAIPSLVTLGRESWSQESGAHGPIVLATGLWLLWQVRGEIAASAGKPLGFGAMLALLVPIVLAYAVARPLEVLFVEIAMLYGIQSARQQQLGRGGIRTRCLISYGEYWFPWYMRRLAERPANVWFVVKNMFR